MMTNEMRPAASSWDNCRSGTFRFNFGIAGAGTFGGGGGGGGIVAAIIVARSV